MTGPFDHDTDVLSRSLNEHARQVPPLPAGPILQQGRRIRRRQRTITGGGLIFSAVLAAGIAGTVVANVNSDRAIVLPGGAATADPVQSTTSAAPAADRFRFAAEFMKQETTLVTVITGRTTFPASGASVPVTLNLVRNPRSNHLPDGVTTSKDPVYVQERIAGVPVWIADNVTRGSRRAAWVHKNQQFRLQADRGIGDKHADVSEADLRALISLAIARS